MPGNCSSATEVYTFGGFFRFARADSNTRGISFSRAITERSRTAEGAKLRLMITKIAFDTPDE